jgi:hypothetical protein
MTSTPTVLWARFAPSWEQIEPLRLFVESFARTRIGAECAAHAGMAVSELVENAVKYGDLAQDIQIEVRLHGVAGETLMVSVSNHAQPARIRILQKEFAACQGEQASTAFARAVDRLQRLPQGTSMLGLARIAAEVDLDLRVDGGEVTMTARIEPTRRRGASGGFSRPASGHARHNGR